MERIVNLALSCDAAVFGGYIRDVVICGGKEFNDIDILWPAMPKMGHSQLDLFLRILSSEPWVESFKTTRLNHSERYGGHYDIEKVVINKTIKLDCIIFPGHFSAWLQKKECDFSCNLFYMTCDVYIGLRYIPDEYKYVPNPTHACYELTKQKKFMTILNRGGDSSCARAASRALKLVKAGWTLEGDVIPAKYLNNIIRSYQFVLRTTRRVNQIMADRAVGVIAGEIGENCANRVRRRLFDEESDSLTESVASNESEHHEDADNLND